MLALECGAPPGGRSKAIYRVGRAAPDALRGRRPSKYVGRRPKMGGSRIDYEQSAVLGHKPKLLKPHRWPKCCNREFKACRFYWHKPFGCAPPKAPFYEATFSHNPKVDKSQIEIVFGINIFAEHFLSLLPTLGRSANLNEPWAPRKDASRSLGHFL